MRVMIATPSYDGRLDVWYTNSLVNTIKESIKRDIQVFPMWVCYDALIQRTRNDLLDIAVKGEYDYVFWIDSDIEWKPEDFFKLIESGYDVVGGTYPKKSDKEEYVVKMSPNTSKAKKEYIEVAGLGTGFLCISKKAAFDVWQASESYLDHRDDDRGGAKKMAFPVSIIDGNMYSEDIMFCKKLTDLGYKVMFNTTVTCNHYGGKKYVGDFSKWFFKINML